jgi:predicted permease
LLLAIWLVKVVSTLPLPVPVSVAFDLTPDARVLLFTSALSVVTGLLFGLTPALRASRPNLVPVLKGEAELVRTRRWPLRSVLVGAEMALCTVLLVLAALLLRSFLAASRADIRFDAAHAAYAAINVAKQFPDQTARARFLDEAERRIAALPGVTAVARTDRLPFALTGNVAAIEVAGVRGPLRDGAFSVDVTNVSARYFDTLGIPILSGRAFDARDRGTDSMPAIIVNQTAARLFWPGRDAVGARLKVRGDREWTVVGVAADHPVRSVGERPRPFVHFAIDQVSPGFVNVVARSNGSAETLASAMRRELLALEPRLAFMGMEPVSKMADITLVPARAATWLLGAFGGLALVLALVGLYGVVSFTVARDTRNIGIRMALGATTGRILTDVLRSSVRIAGAGALAGLGLAALAAQAVSGFLVGVTAFDLVSYVGAAAILLTAALVAALVPARRASRTNAIQAIRS